MTHGKNICKQLKEVRKRIAEENNIPLEIEECTFKGECRGTCPRCEAEVRYLENALANRLKLGKVATVAGLALGLAGPVAAQDTIATVNTNNPKVIEIPRGAGFMGFISDEPKKIEYAPIDTLPTIPHLNRVVVSGSVVDSKTDEPMPFVNVIIADGNNDTVGTGYTNFDGNFSIDVPHGNYTISFTSIGYAKYVVFEDRYDENRNLPTIKLVCTAEMLEGFVSIKHDIQPVLEIAPYGASQYLEKDGVKVIVR